MADQEVGTTDGMETFSPHRYLKHGRSYQLNSVQHHKTHGELKKTRLMDAKYSMVWVGGGDRNKIWSFETHLSHQC
jgi:hypothetical protein